MVGHICNPSTLEAEVGRCGKPKTRLVYIALKSLLCAPLGFPCMVHVISYAFIYYVYYMCSQIHKRAYMLILYTDLFHARHMC